MPSSLPVRTPARPESQGSPSSQGSLLHRFAAAVVLALLAALLLMPVPALADPPVSITVTDTTGTVDAAHLEDVLEGTEFRGDVDLVVLVLDVTDHGFDPSEDTALNDSVLAHARESAPELIAADDDHWADGTVILALDPGNRFLGTYAGEDVKLDEEGFRAVQDAMRDDARNGEWEAALQAGADEYADLLDRPWWRSPTGMVTIVVAIGVAALTALRHLILRRNARRRVDESLPRLDGVLAKRHLTDVAARTLPTGSPYAQAALTDHGTYLKKLEKAENLRHQVPLKHHRRWGWGLPKAHRMLALNLERTVTSLDDLDDYIIGTNDLLHRIGDWRAAWERELAPLQDSIDALEYIEVDGEDITYEEAATLADLLELGGGVALEIQELTTKLEADEITTEGALERLDTLTTELSAGVAALQSLRIAHRSADEEEAEVMRDASWQADLEVEERHYRSVRGRRHALESAGDASSDAFWQISPLLWYSTWHEEADSDLQSHREPSSSSTGSTSGYSPSSGGFSGASSSSRF